MHELTREQWPSRYLWGFIIGPKYENRFEVPVSGMQYRIIDDHNGTWTFQEKKVANVKWDRFLRVRITIAKIEDEARLVEILRSVQVVQRDPRWSSLTWAAACVKAIEADGKAVGTSVLDWDQIEHAAREYVRGKELAGYYHDPPNVYQARPTLDLMEGKETLSGLERLDTMDML